MAFAQLKMFIAKYDKTIGLCIAAVLIFFIGWQTGHIMSPYYASSQIVFEDRTCNTCPSSVGTPESLQELREGTKSPDTGAVSGTSDSRGTYVGSKNSTLFHHYSCSSAKSIKLENQVWYASYDAAVTAGRSPSSCTQKLPR
ncbi:MAG: hypothetical protein O3A36_00665 [bacterium]|nr:hypothetical protein [bacterium]